MKLRKQQLLLTTLYWMQLSILLVHSQIMILQKLHMTTAVAAKLLLNCILDAQHANCAITDAIAMHCAYLKGADPEDIELLTMNDIHFVLNKKKIVQMKLQLHPYWY